MSAMEEARQQVPGVGARVGRRHRIRSLRFALEGNIDLRTFLGLDRANAGCEAIKVKVKIDTDACQDKVDALHQKVVGTSPVGHTLERAVPVTIELDKPPH